MRRLFLLIILVVCVALIACAPTVKGLLKEKKFQQENEPVRTLRLAVFSDGSMKREEIEQAVSSGSQLLESQIGVRWDIKIFKLVSKDEWECSEKLWCSIPQALNSLVRIVQDSGILANDFDMFVMFGGVGFSSWIWRGVIDDTYRRFIVLPGLSSQILAHEVGHAFLFAECHGPVWTLMFWEMTFGGDYLSPDNRKDMLKNKWRRFDEKPVLGTDCQRDKLKK